MLRLATSVPVESRRIAPGRCTARWRTGRIKLCSQHARQNQQADQWHRCKIRDHRRQCAITEKPQAERHQRQRQCCLQVEPSVRFRPRMQVEIKRDESDRAERQPQGSCQRTHRVVHDDRTSARARLMMGEMRRLSHIPVTTQPSMISVRCVGIVNPASQA